MRGIMISMTVILFTLSISIVNEVEARHFTETNQTLFGFTAAPSNNYTSFSDVDNNNIRSEMEDLIESEGESAGIFDSVFSSLIYPLKLAKFLYNVIFNSSIGFSDFIQDLGRPGLHLVPNYIALPVSLFINICHLLVLLQILGGSLRDGL